MSGENQQLATPPVRTMHLWAMLGAILIIVVIAAGGSFLYRTTSSSPPSSPEVVIQNSVDMYTTLQLQNPDFAAGMRARSVGDFVLAVTSLGKALQETTDHADRGIVAYWLADSESLTGQYQQAIPLLKTIAADGTYAPIVRAYAIQEMGVIYYRLRDSNITAAIFKDQPYVQLQVANDAALSYRHIFEYAAALYPLALSELRIATWYANDALSVTQEKAAGTIASSDADAAITSDIAAVRAHFLLADAHQQAVQSKTIDDTSYTQSLLQRAVLLGKMSQLGDTSLGDPEAAFTALLARYQKRGFVNDGSVRLQYAIFLAAKYGAPRATDIQTILAPLIQDPKKSMGQFASLAAEVDSNANNADLKASYVQVASFDPDFKKLLISYGWTDSDFTR